MMLDVLPTTLEINHAISHVRRWMKPSRRSTELRGELEDPNAFSSLPFNHIIFTGSPGVGRMVMRQAAQHSSTPDRRGR
jgi:hypothetical protein